MDDAEDMAAMLRAVCACDCGCGQPVDENGEWCPMCSEACAPGPAGFTLSQTLDIRDRVIAAGGAMPLVADGKAIGDVNCPALASLPAAPTEVARVTWRKEPPTVEEVRAGWFGQVLVDRELVLRFLAPIDAEQRVLVHLRGPRDAVRLSGANWCALVMPMVTDDAKHDAAPRWERRAA